MNAWRQLLIQPVLRRRAQGKLWVTWAALVALVVPLAGVLLDWVPPRAGATVAGVLLSVVTVLWWTLHLQTSVQMNTPAAACLVPGLRRRLMTLTALLWAIGSLPAAALFGAASGLYGYSLLANAAVLLFLAISTRYMWFTLTPTVVWLATSMTGYSDEAATATIAAITAAGEMAVTLGGLVVLAAVGAVALCLLFPRGGDTHYRIEQRLERQIRATEQGKSMFADANPFLRVLDGLYYARLASPGRPGPRMLDAFGAGAHWGRSVVIIAAIGAVGVLFLKGADAETVKVLTPLVPVAMLLMIVMHVGVVLGALKTSPVEQGVLRLTPGAPPSRDLNRQLALALLGRFGMVWCAYVVCSTAVVIVTGTMWNVWICCAALALPFASLLLRDHARNAGWAWAQLVAGALLLAVTPLAGIATYGRIPQVAIAAFVATLLASSAIALAWRWRSALAAPPAFPAGRMAP